MIFDHDPPVDIRPVRRIRLFGMIGMDGMGIIRRDHKTPCNPLAQPGIGLTQSLSDTEQDIGKKGGIRPLLRCAAYLFIVKYYCDLPVISGAFRTYDPFRQRKGAL